MKRRLRFIDRLLAVREAVLAEHGENIDGYLRHYHELGLMDDNQIREIYRADLAEVRRLEAKRQTVKQRFFARRCA